MLQEPKIEIAKAITLEEHVSHAGSHLGRAQRHLQTLKEHHAEIGNYGGFAKAEGAGHNPHVVHHMVKAAEHLGRTDEQQKMATRHLNALTGNSQYGENQTYKAGEKAAHDAGLHLTNAAEHLNNLAEHSVAPIGETSQEAEQRKTMAAHHHKKMGEHLDAAADKLQAARSELDASLHPEESQVDNNPTSPLKTVPDIQQVLKGSLIFKRGDSGKPTDDFELFVPITKAAEQMDGTLIVEAWANVSDLIDGQGEYFSPEGLRKFAESWAPFGNFRGQHDPQWPAGTIKSPRLGKGTDEPLGWWIQQHPVTKTDGLFVRCHVLDENAIKFIKAGVFTGLSVGGRAPAGAKKEVTVEVDDDGVVLREVT